MISEGKKIPVIDKKIHHPEGLRVRSLIHLTEDWVIGKSYRIFIKFFPKVSFTDYLKYFVSIFSSLSVIIIFFFASSFWGNKFSGILSAFFYAIGLPSFWRVTGNYLREEFALPFLFLSLYLFFLGLKEKRKGALFFLSGLSLTIGLITWHLSQFFFSLFALFLIFLFFFGREIVEDSFKYLFFFLIPILIAGLFWEPLASKYFLLSFPVITSLWLGLISLKKGLHKLFALLPLPLFFLFRFLFPRYFQEYAHVFETIFAKIIYLGKKPADPALLSFSARAIWLGPFSSPGPLSFAFSLLIPFLLSLISFLYLLFRPQAKENKLFLSFFFILFTILYLLVIRLEVFFFFFVALAIGGNWLLIKKRWGSAILIIGLLLEGYKVINYQNLFNKYYFKLSAEWQTKPTAYGRDWEALRDWVERNVKGEEGILADVDISAMLLAYTERPIVIQPIYEKKEARDRVLECLSSFYKSEEEFFSLLKRYQISYIIYQKDFLLDNTKEGVRYLTDNLKVKKNSVAYLMHCQPESLKRLSLLYQTNTFRIYRVLREGEGKKLVKLPYSPYFDQSLFPQEGSSPYWDDRQTKEVEENVFNAIKNYNQGLALMRKEEYEKAISKFLAILENFKELERTNYYLGVCYEKIGEKEKAFSFFEKAIEYNPNDLAPYLKKAQILDEKDDFSGAVGSVTEALMVEPENKDLYSLFGYLYLKRNKPEEAIKELEKISSLFPKNPLFPLYIGYLYAYKNDLINAERQFLKAKDLAPTNFEIYSALGSLYLQKDEKEKALTYFEQSLQINPNQPELKKRLSELRRE
ncbi:MAG: tetratricopeptide repeat protein [candidate division WOR-3 bacterium]